MKISVIIPTYNRAEMVANAVESVLSQTCPPTEIIVVDDGSTDHTVTRLAAFQNQIKVIRQCHQGVSAARNVGIQTSRGDWLAFLDSDDLWKRKKLERQCKALDNHVGFMVCYTNEEWRQKGRWRNQKKIHRKYNGRIFQKCLPLCIISPSSVLLHRKVIKEIGLFDESLPACEDYDYWLRTSRRFAVLYIDERLIVKRAGDWEQLSQQHSLDRYRIQALQKVLKDPLANDDRQAAVEELRKKCSVYAQGCKKHQRPAQARWALDIMEQFKEV